jgi:hypothetical protein
MKAMVAVVLVAVGTAILLPVVVLVTVVAGLGHLSAAASTDIPPEALAAYQAAVAYCPGLPWTVLAGIGEVESDHGRSDAPGVHRGANAAGAEGPMQFLPATFAEYAVGPAPSPYAMVDATVAAARLLCANGATAPDGLPRAIWSYNHDWNYVGRVLQWAARYAASAAAAPAAPSTSAAAPATSATAR